MRTPCWSRKAAGQEPGRERGAKIKTNSVDGGENMQKKKNRLIRMSDIPSEQVQWLWYLCDESHKYHYVTR